jgi:hypothetical protein
MATGVLAAALQVIFRPLAAAAESLRWGALSPLAIGSNLLADTRRA